MSNLITDYQKWKQQGENLRVQAKQAMETRFRELLGEAVEIAEEYRTDFGATLKPPPNVTAFRYKAAGKGKVKPKKVAAKVSAAPVAAAPVVAKAAPNPKVVGLQKKLATAKKKLDE